MTGGNKTHVGFVLILIPCIKFIIPHPFRLHFPHADDIITTAIFTATLYTEIITFLFLTFDLNN